MATSPIWSSALRAPATAHSPPGLYSAGGGRPPALAPDGAAAAQGFLNSIPTPRARDDRWARPASAWAAAGSRPEPLE
jgi:hypothetical protein